MSYVTAWVTLLSTLVTLVLAIIGVALLNYDIRLRERQLSESRARASSALEVELRTSVHYGIRGKSAQLEPVLETRVFIKNISSEIWAVPLVYLQARAAPSVSRDTQVVRTFSEWDFDRLSECGLLSRPLNVARFKNTVLYIPPGECESVVRWDSLTESFIHDFPLVIVKLEVFSVPDSVMGVSYSSGSSIKREKWLEFIEDQDGARHRKVIASVAPADIHDGPRKGEWAFLKSDTDEIDDKKSQSFRDVLVKMSKTGRQSLVVLSDELLKRQNLSLLLGPSSKRELVAMEEGASNQKPKADT